MELRTVTFVVKFFRRGRPGLESQERQECE